VRITTKGQVTIPQELRRKYQLDSHAEVEFSDEDGKIILSVVKKSESPIHSLVGRGDVRLTTDEILSLTRSE
jgi:AbrB family looped-hinge helix DNA binding protein